MGTARETGKKRDHIRPNARKFDRGTAYALSKKNVPQTMIAQMMGVDNSTVCRGLKEFEQSLLSPQEVKEYEDNEDRVLTTIKSKYVSHLLQDDTVKKTSGLQASTIVCQVFDKLRIKQDKSTSNIDVRSVTTMLQNVIQKATGDLDNIQDVVLDGSHNVDKPVSD